MQTASLIELFEYVTQDSQSKNELFKIIESCINKNSSVERRVTPEIIFSLILLPDSERELESKKIKSLELIDIFLKKNSILEPDRQEIESHKSLEEAIFKIYRENSFFVRIKDQFKEQLAYIKSLEERAKNIRETYLGKSPTEIRKDKIVSALKEAPLGTSIMWEIIYDLLHRQILIGTLGTKVSIEGMKKISSDTTKSVSAEKNSQPVDAAFFVPSSQNGNAVHG